MNITNTLSFGTQMYNILHNPITLVFILATADIVTGILKSILSNTYQSHVFKKGLITHVAIVVGLYLFQYYAGDYGLQPIVVPVATAFAAMYISSLYENYKEMGGDLPSSVKKLLDENKDKETLESPSTTDATNSEEEQK